MSKRTIGVWTLVVLLTVSITAVAVLSSTSSAPAPAGEDTFASLQFEFGWASNPPDCPFPDTCGSGGGG